MNFEEKLARIKVNSFSYLRSDWLLEMIKIFGSASEFLKQDAKTISKEGKISLESAQAFLKSCAMLDAQKEMEKTEKVGGKILFNGEEDFPTRLAEIKEAPLLIYARGDLGDTQRASVGMVGTRKISPYGRRAATQLAGDLAQSGIVLVSELARGIDSVVHAQAVKNQSATWALIGTGIGRCYPAENRELARAILDTGGAIISELPFDAAPLAHHFPRRNRLIAGLSDLVVVVEGEVKSGALITAKMALDQGLDVMAVPGPIDSPTSGGPNKLIKEGAGMVLSASDIIDAIPSNKKFGLKVKKLYNESKAPSEPLTQQEQKIIDLICEGSKNIDELSLESSFDIMQLSAILFSLEVAGVLICTDGKYSRSKFN
ncbi:MAG: DNA-processing protein DprA [Campylobacter sp.]|nr:DNA-processing protein DprA [Campylobacter sp.]